MNYRILEPLAVVDEKTGLAGAGVEIFTYEYGEYYGKGYVAADGKFVPMAGSKISPELKKSCQDYTRRERTTYADRIVDGFTTEDIIFNGSSGAAGFVSGSSVSGPQNWKNSEGRSLKSIREEA